MDTNRCNYTPRSFRRIGAVPLLRAEAPKTCYVIVRKLAAQLLSMN